MAAQTSPYTITQDVLMRGELGQTGGGLIYSPRPHTVSSYNKVTQVVTRTETRKGIYVDRCRVESNAANLPFALGWRMSNDLWVAAEWDDDGGSDVLQYINMTSGAQSTTANAFGTGPKATVTPADDDGFLIGARYPFSWISIFSDTTDTGDAPDVVVEYSTAAATTGAAAWTLVAGPNWTTLLDQFTRTDTVFGTGETVWASLFSGQQTDHATTWRKWNRAQTTVGLNALAPEGMYWIKVRVDAADPPGTDFAMGAHVEIGGFVYSQLEVDDGAGALPIPEWTGGQFLPHATGIVALCGTGTGHIVTAWCSDLWA